MCILIPLSLFSAEEDALTVGIEYFQSTKYSEALLSFREIILDSSLSALHSDAYFWIAKSYIALRKIEEAVRNIDFFLQSYPQHRYYAEAFYQKGRLLFLQQEYEKSILLFQEFLVLYGDSPFAANSYYWIGESLYLLGHYDEAHKLFSMIIRKYPSSFKVEAANFKLSLIDLKYREIELLKLLKMSHEEYLKSLEEFLIREKTYEQALSSYQRRLSDALSDDTDSIITGLNENITLKNSEISELKESVSDLTAELNSLKGTLNNTIAKYEQEKTEAEQAAAVQTSTVEVSTPVTSNNSEQILTLKGQALQLKEFYLDWLEKNLESGE